VLIEMPDGAHLWLSPEGQVMDLLHMHCHNDIGEGCGTFTLTFAPRVISGRMLDQLIPINSLVRIFCQDPLHPVTEQESCVMIGRTERHRLQIDRSQVRPVRVITISGRSIASLLLDAHLWYHPGIEKQGGTAGTLTEGEHNFRLYWLSTVVEPDKDPRENIAKILTYFLGLPSRTTIGTGPASTSLADQEAAEHLRAVNPTLTHEQALTRSIATRQQTATQPLMRGGMGLEQLMEDDPTLIPANVQARIARRRQQQGLQGPVQATPARPPATPPATPPAAAPAPPVTPQATPPALIPGGNPLINLRLPNTTVADILDLNNDHWLLFEDGVRVPITSNTALAGSLWNYVHLFVDRLFQEFFTRIEDGVCAIHFRPKPFLQTSVTTGTRFRSNAEMLETLPTVSVDLDAPGQLIALDVARDTTNVYNAFRIMSLQANPFLKEPSFTYQIVPTILTDPQDPSYVRNYGLRDMVHLSPYLAGMPTIPSTPEGQKYETVVETCKRWGKIASVWYGVASELYAGMLTVQGSPRYNCGIRLLTRDDRGEREFYAEGVDHDYDFRTGRYLTTLRVTRGWYLDGPTDARRPPRTEPVT
jgi:hypothetical protein